MTTPSEIFYKIKNLKDKFHKKINENLRDRVKYEAKQTLKIIQRLKNRGLSEREILEDIEKSSEMPTKKYEDN